MVILDETRRGTPGVAVKMLNDGVLPVSTDLEDAQITLRATFQAVACCVFMVPVH